MRKGTLERKAQPSLTAMEAMERVRNMDCLMITPAIAADVLECDAQMIRLQAQDRPELLGFPVVRVGTRTKIPRVPFLRFITGESGKEATE